MSTTVGKKVKVRFAPSPTGDLHVGNIRTALFDWAESGLTAAEQEQAYRERQLKAKEAAEKSGKEQAEAEQLRQSCASAQETLRSLERGSRISTINAAGETVYLDDDQRAARVAQTRKVMSETCK